MKLSAEGLSFIARWEGFVGHVYNDVAGNPTIGYGHLVLRGERWTTITEAQGLELLRRDVALAEAAVNGLGVALSQPQFDALVSFAFNLGGAILGKGHTLGDALRAGDYAGAAAAFELYCKAGGVTNQGLLNRRRSERALFLSAGTAGPVAPDSRLEAARAFRAAVVAFQRAAGLSPDGDPGPMTRAALAQALGGRGRPAP